VHFAPFSVALHRAATHQQRNEPQTRVSSYQEHSRALCRHENPTDPPTYPNLSKASVVGGGNGTATLYNAATHDAYQKVLAWYRSKRAGASEQESCYKT